MYVCLSLSLYIYIYIYIYTYKQLGVAVAAAAVRQVARAASSLDFLGAPLSRAPLILGLYILSQQPYFYKHLDK